jgi:hypothetical protein
MTTQPTSTLSTVLRAALVVALLGQAAALAWIALMPTFAGQPATLLAIASLPVVAAGLLIVRRGLGAALAVVASLIGGLIGYFFSVCFMCGSPQPIPPVAIAIDVASVLVLVLALLELRALRLGWVIIPIAIVFLILANNPIAAALVVVVAIVLLVTRRRAQQKEGPA